MGQLIAVIATTYNFVRLPHAGVRSNDGVFASAVLHQLHRKPAHARSHRTSASSPLSSTAMKFARNADCPRYKPWLR